MVECKNCGHWFRDNYKLNRHLDRLKPCINKNTQSVQNQGEQIHPSDEQIHPSDEQIHPSDEQFHPLDEQIHPLNKCVYCSNTFYNNSSLKRHTLICKMKEDPIRLLEIKYKINPVTPESKLDCRFCNKTLSTMQKLTNHFKVCKEREDYLNELLNKETCQVNNVTNNNVTNNNITNNTFNDNRANNIFILSFGNENLDNIRVEDIMNDVNKLIEENGNSNNYIIAGKLLTKFEERVKENPENKNIKLRSINSNYGEIKTDRGMKKVKIEKFLDSCIKNTAKNFNKKKSSIKTKNRETKKILNHVDTYATIGYKIPTEIDSLEISEDSKEDLKEFIIDKNLEKDEIDKVKENLNEIKQEHLEYIYTLINESS